MPARSASAEASFSDRLALLVVDVQERLLRAMPDAESLTARLRFSIQAARLLGIEVLFTEQVPEKLGPTLLALAELAPGALRAPKTAFSSLQAEGVRTALSRRKIEHLLLCGIETPVCVYQTAVQAMRAEYDVTVLVDAVGARRPADAEAVLGFLARHGAHILPAEAVFYSLLADAKHPRFKAFTELVKRTDAASGR